MADTTTSPAAGEQVDFEGELFVNPPVTRQWVSVKVFTLPATVDDRTALAAMIGHAQYLDSYAGPWDVVDKHGPYWLHAITPQTFVVVADLAQAETLIRTWAECYVRWHDADREAMDREVYGRLRRATVIYQLPDIRATAQHDWGDVVGSDGFHEFVTVDRATGELALIVASDD